MAFSGAWDVVGLRTTASVWDVAKKYGPNVEAHLLLYQECANKRGKIVASERDIEHGMPSYEEESEHNVENFMLCSFGASCVQLCKVALP